jgi:hypothetical protein
MEMRFFQGKSAFLAGILRILRDAAVTGITGLRLSEYGRQKQAARGAGDFKAAVEAIPFP